MKKMINMKKKNSNNFLDRNNNSYNQLKNNNK